MILGHKKKKHHKGKTTKYEKNESATSKTDIQNMKQSPEPKKKHKKHRKKHKIGSGFKKFGRGIVKRGDSVGKFTGGIIKTQSNAISGLLDGLSNPIVLVGIVLVGGVIIYQVTKK